MGHAAGAPLPTGLRRPMRTLRLAGDERLVALVRDGDERAFEVMYDRHHRAILGFCRHMVGSREEAEDVLQHTFLSAYRDLVAGDKAIALRPWLFAIARNRCLSLLRARREQVALDAVAPSTDGLGAIVEAREDLRELLADLAQLPDDQRAALLLAELGALDHAGIANVLGCPREKVKALVFQARASLAADREARATPCAEIRLELATATGAALRRGPLRRHLRACAGCSAFGAEVAGQRKLLALALPVVPGATVKAGALLGGGGGAFASSGAAKVAVSLTVAGALAGGGALTGLPRDDTAGSAPPPAAVARVPAGFSSWSLAPAARHAPATLHGPSAGRAQPRRASGRPGPRASAGVPHRPSAPPAPFPSAGDGGAERPPGGGPGAAERAVPLPRQAPGGPSATDPVPGPGPSAAVTPPGQGGTPPGHGGTPPGQGGTPPGQGGTPPGQGGTPPGQSRTPPGQGGTPPGQGGTPPGQGGTPPGQGGTPPGQGGTPPGQGGTPPGQGGTPPGQGGTPPGQGGVPDGPSRAAPSA